MTARTERTEPSQVDTLADALPREIKRVRELRELYLGIGVGGLPAALLMQQSIDRAQHAIDAGDVVAMLRALPDLQGWTD